MVRGTIAANYIMGTYIGLLCGEGFQCLRTAVLSGVVDDDKIWLAQIKISGTHPRNMAVQRIGHRRLPQLPGKCLCLLFIHAVGCSIRVAVTTQNHNKRHAKNYNACVQVTKHSTTTSTPKIGMWQQSAAAGMDKAGGDASQLVWFLFFQRRFFN